MRMESEKKTFVSRLNPLSSCRKYRVPVWQCPQFLFLIMGIIIIGAIITAYILATLRIGDPVTVSMIVLTVGAVLLVINFVITNSFERIAEASRMKTEFIDIVSHQLRAPLTNLRFSLDILASDRLNKPTERQFEYFTILQENTKRMGGLVDNLLTVSRMETGRFPMKKLKISLVKITHSLLEEFKGLIEASNVKISLDMPETISDVFSDPLWLEQVVENLLDNAVRYSKGGGEIHITLKEKNNRVYFSIRDNGVGIPKDEQKHIFTKFFRSGNALKKQTKGSGLGLHIAQKIVERCNGKIWFDSKENHGTTFHFYLPVAH